jgi:hypothetical protein
MLVLAPDPPLCLRRILSYLSRMTVDRNYNRDGVFFNE